MNDFNSIGDIFAPATKIDEDCQVVFVADMFASEYEGGAELTTEALISSSPMKVCRVKSNSVTLETLKQGIDKFWIFGNFAGLNPQLIPSIIGNLKYSVLEYDYKYCRFRSPEKHRSSTGSNCDCHEQINGKLISAFYYGAEGMWWMSEGQKKCYADLFPFLLEKSSIVLSSVFSKATLATLRLLRNQMGEARKNWLVLGSESWIKGADAAKKWCEENEKPYDVVWGVKYDELLARMAASEGFVYLPKGKDTCPRMVIEAKLLGCKLHINENVQHANEDWFSTDNLDEIEEYLYAAHDLFWNGIKGFMDYKPTISGYITTRNCIDQKYPYEQSIKSLLQFCDEVCVVDGGSTDGTWETLTALATVDQRVKIKQVPRDWSHQRHAVFDGMQKAEARSMCTSEYCWQMDCDEVVHEDDAQKIAGLCKRFPSGVDIVVLPVVEYWGSEEKVRADIFPWKWRLSKNKPYITHGIPVEARLKDEEGNVYAAYGDGCDMIHNETGKIIPHLSFYSQEVDSVRKAAVTGDPTALAQYEQWFNSAVDNLPGVFHYSWYDIERKMHLYKKYWTQHWESLYGKKYEDTAESNMMFDVPWSQVTDQMIKDRAAEFSQKLGGWIWHQKWDGVVRTHHIKINKSQPKIMKDIAAP